MSGRAAALVPAQEGLVHLPTEGQFLVRGAAGSGKTTVALARAIHLARQPLLHGAPRVLLLARSPSLAAELAAALDARGERDGAALRERIDVTTVASWCRDAAVRAGEPVELVAPAQFVAIVDAALQLVRRRSRSEVLRRPLSFFTTELETMLLALGVERFEQYTPVAREGRGSPLDEEARKSVFAVFEEFRAIALRLRTQPPLALVPGALARLARERRPLYDHVVVDDAHRLAPIELELVRQLAAGGSLTLFASLEQRFDPLAARLRDLGLERLDRTEVLTATMRCPAPILAAALAVLRRRGSELEENGLRSVEVGSIPGDKPRLLLCRDWRHEFDVLVAEVARLRDAGRPLRDVAVLASGERALALAQAELARAGLGGVQLSTLDDAAGREWPVVFVLDVNRGSFPRLRHDLAEHERADADVVSRRALHLAMTRARESLVLLATEATRSPLVPAKKVVVERVGAASDEVAAAATA
jgi:superfamily I DNA/RNA helicase